MPTVRTIDGYTIKVNTRGEHNPAHVHVFKAGWEIRIRIDGDAAELWDVSYGDPNSKELARAVDHVQDCWAACRESWRMNNAHL